MRTAILTAGGFNIQERPMPECGPGQMLVRSTALGICEGDVFHYRMRGELNGEQWLGHEGTGVVQAVGQGVEGFAEGDTVTTLGGLYGEYYVTPAAAALHVPAGVDPTLALGEPIACCVHAANRFGIRLGDRVALIGSGFMGLMCQQLARLQGAASITAIEPIAWRRGVAERLGADTTVSPEGQTPEGLAAQLGEFDVVIEATGVPAGIDLVGDLVRQHGRVIIIGYHQTNQGMRNVNMKQWNFKAIDVINGHVRRDDEKREAMRVGLELMRTGRLDVTPLVTSYGFGQVEQAFRDLAGRKEGLFKAVLTI